MTDYISRADAIDAVAEEWLSEASAESPYVNDEDIDKYRELAEELFSDIPSAELPKGDLISRADVLKYPIRLDHYDEVNGDRVFVYGVESVIEYVESLPSADAVSREDYEDIIKDYRKQYENMNNEIADLEAKLANCVEVDRTSKWVAVRREEYEDLIADAVPTVIRATTFMRKEDFDKWAEDIKKQNKSIVCIPCDAEVVSADAVQGDECDHCVYKWGMKGGGGE